MANLLDFHTRSTQCVRLYICIIITLLICSGCAGTSSSSNSEDRVYLNGQIISLQWDTNGGGDLHFQTTRNGSDFQVHVTANMFQDMDRYIILTISSPNIYNIVSGIFDGSIDVYDYVSESDPDAATGTWTEIALTDSLDQEIVIKHIDLSTDMGLLSEFVKNHI